MGISATVDGGAAAEETATVTAVATVGRMWALPERTVGGGDDGGGGGGQWWRKKG